MGQFVSFEESVKHLFLIDGSLRRILTLRHDLAHNGFDGRGDAVPSALPPDHALHSLALFVVARDLLEHLIEVPAGGGALLDRVRNLVLDHLLLRMVEIQTGGELLRQFVQFPFPDALWRAIRSSKWFVLICRRIRAFLFGALTGGALLPGKARVQRRDGEFALCSTLNVLPEGALP